MLKIYNEIHPTLRQKAIEIPLPIIKEDEDLALEMLKHIKESQDEEFAAEHCIRGGVGLAAPQVGVSKRIIVVLFDDGTKEVCHVLANPSIISNSIKRCFLTGGEGCLSVDDPHPGNVYRYNKITVKAYDVLEKKDIIFNAFGYEAIVLQHEIDHLNGVLFYDHIDPKNFTKFKDAVQI